MKPSNPESDHHEKRKEVHNLSIRLLKEGLLHTNWLSTDFHRYAAAISPILFWDLGVLSKVVISIQLFSGTILELGTDVHQKWIKMAEKGEVIGGFAMCATKFKFVANRSLNFL